ncbi:hypothetical protein RFI_25400 [Reticulomyxa filosa]|uniref:Uncharacterized protein n=1 Tax=Reticulomyxa filosa TaxID=46433 RepID=X6MEA0_RETFI|nr:hypothetical protein RFI_25400 [Reticulomyxa filosa]|eukprot:ETO11976.1 hypothetical protein RFI_25400 [Reticulomyxa filosa]
MLVLWWRGCRNALVLNYWVGSCLWYQHMRNKKNQDLLRFQQLLDPSKGPEKMQNIMKLELDTVLMRSACKASSRPRRQAAMRCRGDAYFVSKRGLSATPSLSLSLSQSQRKSEGRDKRVLQPRGPSRQEWQSHFADWPWYPYEGLRQEVKLRVGQERTTKVPREIMERIPNWNSRVVYIDENDNVLLKVSKESLDKWRLKYAMEYNNNNNNNNNN